MESNEGKQIFEDELVKDYREEKYCDDIEFDEKLIAKLNRRKNQKADRNRMVVDSAGLKDTFRIMRNRYIKKYGRD